MGTRLSKQRSLHNFQIDQLGSDQLWEDASNLDESQSLSREEQYEWFKFLRDSSEDEVVQHMKDNIQMCTAVMQFKIYSEEHGTMRPSMFNISVKLCSCAFELEQGIKPSKLNISALELLEYCIKFGKCPHYILDHCCYDNNLRQTICVENIYEENVNAKEGSHCRYGGNRSAGLYWIHLLLILGRTRIVIEVLKFISSLKIVLNPLLTSVHKFSSLHLALIHNLDDDLPMFLPHFKNLLPYSYFHFNYTENDIDDMVSALDLAIDREKIDILKWLICDCNIKSSEILEQAVGKRKLKCIDFLKDMGLPISKDYLYQTVEDCIKAGDLELLSAILELKGATKEVECSLLQLAVDYGHKDSVLMILTKLFPRGQIKRTNMLFQMRCFVVSILLHDFDKFQIFIDFGMNYNSLLHGHSILWWAETFGQNEILRLLREKGTKSLVHDINRDDPFEPLFCLRINVLANLKHLLEHGWGIDVLEREDMTLNKAMKYSDEGVRKYLIEKGLKTDKILNYAEYLLSINFLSCHNHLQAKSMFCIFIDCNVELSSNGENSFVRLVADFPTYLKLVLSCAHTIESKDKQFLILKFLYLKSSNNESSEFVDKILFSPKLLSTLCRDSIRKHYGRKFPKFIKCIEHDTPNKLLHILQCEASKEIFMNTRESDIIV